MIEINNSFDHHCDSKVIQKPIQHLFLYEAFGSEAFISQIPTTSNGLGAPEIIDPRQLIDLLDKAINGSCNQTENDTFIDQRILVNEHNKLVWYYHPKATQPFYYKHKGHTLSAPIHWCTFVFKKVGARLSVGVIQHNKRPTLQTRVYHAPLPNVYESTAICLGNCSLPESKDIDLLSETYFNSVKTHLNFNGMLRNQTTNDQKFRTYIRSKRKNSIRVSELTPFGTIASFIK